jgi:hypothetical protein
MALRLGEYVVYGELYNKSNYCTHGIIVLRGEEPGEETVVRLDLTGNCDKDLRGKGFRFRPREEDADGPAFPAERFPRFQIGQFGPTATMTAQGWVKDLPCSVEEYLRRKDLGEEPPIEWKRHLYLEWYSQNGRVVVEMVDPVVEECVRESRSGSGPDDEDEGDWVPLPNLALPPFLEESEPGAGLEITSITRDGDDYTVDSWTPTEADMPDEDEEPATPLQQHFAAESDAIDRALHGGDDEPESDTTRELERMDECMDHGVRQPLFLLLNGTSDLKPDGQLDDIQAEAALKGLLVQMAMVGVALDVCEHFTPRDCYRLLRDKVLLQPNAYPGLVGTGWGQHVMTCEHCSKCEAEWKTDLK